jgi:enterochelin esterase-like enzyme/sugar lactone lactonase YvrE
MNKVFFSLLFIIFTIQNPSFAQQNHSEKIPQGKILSFTFSESKIFPGTQRTITVYIPEQLNPSISACVYIQQDGFRDGQNLNLILDTLIARHEMPVTVGIFVTPGMVPSPIADNPGRPNRCFEYDAVGDQYARFILEEVLPKVSKEYHLNLTKNANDRCIAGVSSGGIAAFNAAWERPDAFSRVYCVSGSFVGFRFGNMFPTLVRKTEAKPIRAFTTTGTNDMENCAGDWTLLDLEMDKAMKFSGYDYRFMQLKGGHGVGWKEHFAEAMRYLWKGWPTPIQPGISAPRVRDIILPSESWQDVKVDASNITAAASNSKGEVFFIDGPKNKIFRIGLDGIVSNFVSNAGFSNGIAFGALDELYTVSEKTGKIMCYDPLGKGKILSEGVLGHSVFSIPEGGLYVIGKDNESKSTKVWLVKNGKKTVMDHLPIAAGIAMTPDRGFLTIGESSSHWAYSYQVGAEGKLINKERFFTLHTPDWEENAGTEDLCYDREGHLYVATRSGIQICAWDGPTQVILPSPAGRITRICFGGADLDMLFAFCGNKIIKRKVKGHALGAYTPWTKMTPGKL